ncbi:MAG TPA: membrane protein insertase YidC [Terriglobales bacterium]|jgi:YidC/Oxa1 family membrane protein insertase
MERRLLLVFALTFIVILASQPLLKKYLPQPAPESQQQQQTQSQQKPESVAPAPAAPARNDGSIQKGSAETTTVIENNLYRITFTNRGAQVKSWILKKFDDDQGKPLDLVHSVAAAKHGYPLSLWTWDENQRNKLNSVLYVASASGSLSAPTTLSFEYSDKDLTVRKKFTFDQTYVVHVETSVVSNGNYVSAFPAWPAGFGDENSPAAYAAETVSYQVNSTVERLAVKKVSGGGVVKPPMNWAGVTDQYFAAVFLPDDAAAATLVTLHNTVDVPKDPQKPQDTIKADVLGAAVGTLSATSSQRLFVGPRALDVLEAVPVTGMPPHVEADLRQVVDFGWLGVIARPLFVWLRWTHTFIPNWGWAIALQTLIINLALLPLRISQMKSALKMQKVAPQIKAIQDKYKKYSMRDPRKQEMNQEVAALYKQEGVNPVGGCLPLVIQMPFLFAYYRMLGVALDLRHANWLWIRDLSSADPYHILPIAVIITMLITQRMTPQAGMDPSQQKMMNVVMPVMLGAISWNLPAGLCLYWSEGSLIGIVQQYVMNKTALGREMREMAAKRARKKDKDK